MSRAMIGDRVMSKVIPSTIMTFGAGTATATNGWQVVQPGSAVYYETYFDCSGYTLDDLTVVPNYTQVQDGLVHRGDANTSSMWVLEIVSQERLDVANLVVPLALLGEVPGGFASNDDWRQLLQCNFKYFLPQTDFTETGLMLIATQGRFGSNEPSTAEKLWIYRIVVLGGIHEEGDVVVLPMTRQILGAEIIKEEDLDYIMRLKRSYELAT